jgi:hypothetical protein
MNNYSHTYIIARKRQSATSSTTSTQFETEIHVPVRTDKYIVMMKSSANQSLKLGENKEPFTPYEMECIGRI